MKKGYRLSAETRQRISEARAGTKLTPEHKEKLRASAKRFWDEVKRLKAAQEQSAA